MAKHLVPTGNAPQGLCLGKGYGFDEVRAIVQDFGFTGRIRMRGVPHPLEAIGAGKS